MQEKEVMEKYDELLRKKIVDIKTRSIKLVKIQSIEESMDSNCHVNCDGFGRQRLYDNFSLFMENRGTVKKRLLRGISPKIDHFRTQVFQNAGCNIRCWYCFVDDCALDAAPINTEWVSVTKMIDVFLQENEEPFIMDLSGGQPDLAPEWCFWIMEELEKRNLRGKVFVWLDDNLLTVNILEKYLSESQIKYMAEYPKHSRACCFKGYNNQSFHFNIRNNILDINEQINNFRKLYTYGFDIYAYITLTGPKGCANMQAIETFINQIQDIDYILPLRIIPLKIVNFRVTMKRINETYKEALQEQYRAYDIWSNIMRKYYSEEEIRRPYEDNILWKTL